jgi:hypothetical protein
LFQTDPPPLHPFSLVLPACRFLPLVHTFTHTNTQTLANKHLQTHTHSNISPHNYKPTPGAGNALTTIATTVVKQSSEIFAPFSPGVVSGSKVHAHVFLLVT